MFNTIKANKESIQAAYLIGYKAGITAHKTAKFIAPIHNKAMYALLLSMSGLNMSWLDALKSYDKGYNAFTSKIAFEAIQD